MRSALNMLRLVPVPRRDSKVVVAVLFFLLIIVVVGIGASCASAQTKSEIKINGQQVRFDAHPYIDGNNRTMVPIRFISENLGAKVDWDGRIQTVTVSKGSSVVRLQVGSDIIEVNGVKSTMDTSMVYNREYGRNFVPLRFVTENLGSRIESFEQRSGGTFFISILDDDYIPGQTTEIEPVVSQEGIYGIAIGDSSEHVLATLGNPGRQEPSGYGYQWWVYNQDYHNFVMVGVETGRVVTIYSNSNHWDYEGVGVGTSKSAAFREFPYSEEIIIQHDGATFTVQQSSSGLEKYLALDSDKVALELYLDIHNQDRVTAIRLSEPRLVLAEGNYGMKWTFASGQRPNYKPKSLTFAEQQAVDKSNQLQLFDLVNAIRVREGLSTLEWHQPIAEVAYSHSVDMSENSFFRHESPSTGSMADRVKAAGISFGRVTENIAMGQSDAIVANEGLMNSYGHRVNILDKEVTALGTGAYYKYYTQKFLRPR